MAQSGNAAINLAIVLALLVFMDWGLPPQLRNVSFGVFKRSYEDFYAAYHLGRKARLIIALILATVVGLVTAFGDQIALMFTMVFAIFGYVVLIGYYMWCAETGRQPWR